MFNALSEKQNKKYELNNEKMNSLKKPKKGDKMFEEDFFEVDELRKSNPEGKAEDFTFDIWKYIRAMK